MQDVLNVVAKIEDKYLDINSLEGLQELQIEDIIEKKTKAIESKFSKLIESKLRYYENNMKFQEKLIKKKLDNQIYNNNILREANSNLQFNQDTNDANDTNNSNIYKEIKDNQVKDAADTIYNKELDDMIKKLKNKQIELAKKASLNNNKNQILGFTEFNSEQ